MKGYRINGQQYLFEPAGEMVRLTVGGHEFWLTREGARVVMDNLRRAMNGMDN
jgi:hypothetical protein